ncbi:hypothetical protein NQ317_000928 [Molorchus minor]|uniref:Protein phosphatase methylesterase 1 n=1 Tax=Molorchus minor TaxID=1323400 RepID=A0ABQ9K1B4_9CUCU|nr:hypothetical protein NQ317_000928 [Molorchus minor]
MADLRKSLLGLHSKRSGLSGAANQNFTPIKWSEYFDKEEKIETARGKFHVYSKGNEGPILLCLHGGGYSGLTWALFAVEISNLIHCQVVAVDGRGHGHTNTENDYDLSLDTLAKDIIDIAEIILEEKNAPIILMGHSMGGAVAVEAAYHINAVKGLCVIDVVEGTALDALSSMQSILRGRPSHFKTIKVVKLITWKRQGMKTGKLAADECDNIDFQNIELSSSSHRELVASSYTLTEVAEEGEDKDEVDKCSDCGKPPLPKSQRTEVFKTPNSHKTEDDGPQYAWRIDLSKTESFWTGWFKGLSQKFLDIRIPKLLLLANIHGLDTTLTVGQMQGKFQMQVLARSGHAIHEDQPHNVAEIVAGHLIKQKLTEPKSAYVHSSMPAC